ncbi:phosphotransferase [Actinomadura graeca]|uniref:Phosphotransferase n=1 Tax=Actinomadura graeca TaxID=2750812 RepID=A0ABX8R683_9ACTN|nr:phosphotransferase [Actinomadura graeca]QXJ25477.1 phosphotransferase [Actinomadura graeca]
MIYAETPLTGPMREAVRRSWGHPAGGPAERLFGGEESAAYRLGDVVVRVSPAWRGEAETEWCHAVAAHAAARMPEAVAPLRARDGATVVRVDGRPLSLWPHVEGEWPDEDDPGMRTLAAGVLARLHRALASYRPPPRPAASFAATGMDGKPPEDVPGLADPALDRWLAAFHGRGTARQVVHGDYYSANTLARGGRLVAVLDWDECFVAAPEYEVAAAALEWTDAPAGTQEQRRRFVADYHRAGGTAGPMDDETVAQLIRHRLRREAAYFELARRRGVQHDEDDLAYHEERNAAFFKLRP